jgi:hypothetical protein
MTKHKLFDRTINYLKKLKTKYAPLNDWTIYINPETLEFQHIDRKSDKKEHKQIPEELAKMIVIADGYVVDADDSNPSPIALEPTIEVAEIEEIQPIKHTDPKFNEVTRQNVPYSQITSNQRLANTSPEELLNIISTEGNIQQMLMCILDSGSVSVDLQEELLETLKEININKLPNDKMAHKPNKRSFGAKSDMLNERKKTKKRRSRRARRRSKSRARVVAKRSKKFGKMYGLQRYSTYRGLYPFNMQNMRIKSTTPNLYNVKRGFMA